MASCAAPRDRDGFPGPVSAGQAPPQHAQEALRARERAAVPAQKRPTGCVLPRGPRGVEGQAPHERKAQGGEAAPAARRAARGRARLLLAPGLAREPQGRRQERRCAPLRGPRLRLGAHEARVQRPPRVRRVQARELYTFQLLGRHAGRRERAGGRSVDRATGHLEGDEPQAQGGRRDRTARVAAEAGGGSGWVRACALAELRAREGDEHRGHVGERRGAERRDAVGHEQHVLRGRAERVRPQRRDERGLGAPSSA
mmetsp:Transcript_782/g.2645  ORF Transcript_782/g.2645 Transcript_782/m.2645 type:complete len:256 (+) Transcript_782:548-1315(+)